MRRKGDRGAGQWQEIAWDEALDEMADRLLAVREEHGPMSLVGAVAHEAAVAADRDFGWRVVGPVSGSDQPLAFAWPELHHDDSVLGSMCDS